MSGVGRLWATRQGSCMRRQDALHCRSREADRRGRWQACRGRPKPFSIAGVGDRCLVGLNWAESGPTAVASGSTGIRAITAVPSRARNRLHRSRPSGCARLDVPRRDAPDPLLSEVSDPTRIRPRPALASVRLARMLAPSRHAFAGVTDHISDLDLICHKRKEIRDRGPATRC